MELVARHKEEVRSEIANIGGNLDSDQNSSVLVKAEDDNSSISPNPLLLLEDQNMMYERENSLPNQYLS